MGNLIRGLAVVGVTSASVLSLAAPSYAEPDPPGCNQGNFCIYSGRNQTGTLLVEEDGDWSGSVRGQSIFNNGVPWPGADHIQVYWTFNGSSLSHCVHYNPGPGLYKLNWDSPVTFTRVVWRGEC